MTQTLDYIRIDGLHGGAQFGLIVQFTINGEAVKFARGEAARVTVQSLRDLADRIERNACSELETREARARG